MTTSTGRVLEQPSIQLLPPTAEDWECSRAAASDLTTTIQVSFQLSGIPHPAWCRLFKSLFKFRYDALGNPRLDGKSLTISCLPGQILAFREILQSVITNVNEIVGPMIFIHTSPDHFSLKRSDMLRGRNFDDATAKVAMLRELAQNELDAAMTQMLADENERGQN